MSFFTDLGNTFSKGFQNLGNGITSFLNGDSLFGKGSPFEMVYNPSDWWDRFKNGNASDIARENLQYQRENLDYQKALQQEIFNRNDTQYARTAADMRSAGLNPLSMSSTNEVGEAIATNPLQNTMQDTSNMAALGQILNAANSLRTTSSNSTLQNAQANLFNAQADSQNIKNIYESQVIEANLRKMTQEISNLGLTGDKLKSEKKSIDWDSKIKETQHSMAGLDLFNKKRNAEFNMIYGLTDNMPDMLKDYAILLGKKVYNYGSGGNPDLQGSEFLDNQINKSGISSAILGNKIAESLLGVLFQAMSFRGVGK